MAQERGSRGRSLSEEELAEAEAESDVVDADIEEFEAAIPHAERERVQSTLSEDDLAEADAESDLVDADLEEG
jgi:hypothetical protein